MEGKTSMVDDLENNWKTLETRFLEQSIQKEEMKATREVQETFASPSASLSTNMQVRVMTQLLFEAFNA